MAEDKNMYDKTQAIIAAFAKNQPLNMAIGMGEVAELANSVSDDSLSNDDAQRVYHTLMNLALIGHITVTNVEKGVDKILDADPMKDFNPGKHDDKGDKPGPGNLNFL